MKENQLKLKDKVSCLICGKQMKQITHTHTKQHGLSTNQYCQKFNLKKSDISSQLTKQIRKVTLKNMIRVYGQEEGKKRFDQYRAKQAYTNSFEYKNKTHGWSQQKFKQFNKSRAVTLDLCIQRHGIQKGTKVFQDYCQKQSYAGNKIEYFQQKYGVQSGTTIYNQICKNKAITLDNMVRVYGEQGQVRYTDYIKKQSKRNYKSYISQQLFNSISSYFPYNNFKFQTNGGQKYIRCGSNTYYIDFYDPITHKGIEFNGSFWHADPELYTQDFILNYPGGKKSAKQIREKDKQRLDQILSSKYVNDILIIWQKEYLKDKQLTIQKCIQFLRR